MASSMPDTDVAVAPPWQRSWKKRAEVTAIASLATPLLRLLGRPRCGGGWKARNACVRPSRPAGTAFMPSGTAGSCTALFHFRGRGIVVITSENFDGEWIARIIHRFGLRHGARIESRGARKALLQLVKDVEGASDRVHRRRPARPGASRPARAPCGCRRRPAIR